MTHRRSISVLLALFLATSISAAYAESGIASSYSGGERTASGEHAGALTAAHRTLPFGTMVQVTHKTSGRSIIVRINDRGPFVRGRVIDVSRAGASQLGFSGTAPVVLTVISTPAKSP